MAINSVPPFQVVTRIAGAIISDPNEISLKRLREVVAGRDLGFSRTRAMALLLESDFPNKHRDYERVLANENETPEMRHLAALYLGMTNTGASLEILVKHCQISDEFVLAGVMKALGRIGDEATLDVVVQVQRNAKGAAESQASFAASLIAYRLGLEGHALPMPTDADYVEPPVCYARPMQISVADAVDAETCLRSVARQPLGIEFAEYPMYQIRCERNIWMMLLNRDFTDPNGLATVKVRKTCLGLIARRNHSTGLYAPSFVILTAPSEQAAGVDILVYRLEGGIAFGGKAQTVGDGAYFSIRSASVPRAFAVQMEGSFNAGRLVMKTALSTALGQKQQPVEQFIARPNSFKLE